MSLAEHAKVLRNAAGLYEQGVFALEVRGETIHPECESVDEMQLTKRFLTREPPVGCNRCIRPWVDPSSSSA